MITRKCEMHVRQHHDGTYERVPIDRFEIVKLINTLDWNIGTCLTRKDLEAVIKLGVKVIALPTRVK